MESTRSNLPDPTRERRVERRRPPKFWRIERNEQPRFNTSKKTRLTSQRFQRSQYLAERRNNRCFGEIDYFGRSRGKCRDSLESCIAPPRPFPVNPSDGVAATRVRSEKKAKGGVAHEINRKLGFAFILRPSARFDDRLASAQQAGTQLLSRTDERRCPARRASNQTPARVSPAASSRDDIPDSSASHVLLLLARSRSAHGRAEGRSVDGVQRTGIGSGS